MTKPIGDAVVQETVTTGTGTLTLSTMAATGYRTFRDAFISGSKVFYVLQHPTITNGNVTALDREIGYGTLTHSSGGDTLSRDLIFQVYGSNVSGGKLNLQEGIKRVYSALPAAMTPFGHRHITTSTTLAIEDYGKTIDVDVAANATITMPSGANLPEGWYVDLATGYGASVNATITIATTTGTINGASTISINNATQYDSYRITWHGDNGWYAQSSLPIPEKGSASDISHTGTSKSYLTTSSRHNSSKDFNLTSANDLPRGVTTDGNYIWVLDRTDDKAYAYTLSGTYTSSRDITCHTDNADPHGIATDGTTMWINDKADRKVYAYVLATGARDSGKDFNQVAANNNCEAIAVSADNTTLYAIQGGSRQIYAYTISNGNQDTSKQFMLASVNTAPTGIWCDDTYMWVMDWSDTTIYVYRISDGARQTSLEFNVASANGHKQGGASDGETLWVADNTDDKLYAYNITTQVATAANDKDFITPLALRQSEVAYQCWCNVDQTGASPSIRDSFNVSSITDNGTGDLTISFTNNFQNVNYTTMITAGEHYDVTDRDATAGFRPRMGALGTPTVSSARINTRFYTTGVEYRATPHPHLVVTGISDGNAAQRDCDVVAVSIAGDLD